VICILNFTAPLEHLPTFALFNDDTLVGGIIVGTVINHYLILSVEISSLVIVANTVFLETHFLSLIL
jgi:hypothetical protein